jgi:hypothetical protein
MRVRSSAWWQLAVLLPCVSCGPRTEASSGAEPGSQAPASGEAQPEPPLPRDAPPAQVLVLAGKRYASGMAAHGKTMTGTLAQGARSDHLVVLEAGRCYRIVGVGGEGVQDMDLFLYDPAGVQANQDSGQDRYPVLGKQIEICPISAGAYRLQVQMYEGGGEFAVGVYRSE